MRPVALWLVATIVASTIAGGCAAAAPAASSSVEPSVLGVEEAPSEKQQSAVVQDSTSNWIWPFSLVRKVKDPVRASLFLSQITILLLVLTYTFLMVQCAALMSENERLRAGVRKRHLAERGGHDDLSPCREPSADEGAVGWQEPQTAEDVRRIPVPDLVDRQLGLLMIGDAEAARLEADELIDVSRAKKILQDAYSRREALQRRLVDVERQLTLVDQELIAPQTGIKASAETVIATLNLMEAKKAELQDQLKKEDMKLRQIAWHPVQNARAALKLANAYQKRDMTEEVAATLAAVERVMNPGKLFPEVASSLEGIIFIKMTREKVEQLDGVRQHLVDASEASQQSDVTALRPLVQAQLGTARRLHTHLKAVAMNGTAEELAEAIGRLEEEARSAGLALTPGDESALPEQFGTLSLRDPVRAPVTPSAQEVEEAVLTAKTFERDMLFYSVRVLEVCSSKPTTEEEWRKLHQLFADAAGVYTLASRYEVPPYVPADQKEKLERALEKCRRSLVQLNGLLAPWWISKTKHVDRLLTAAHAQVRRGVEHFVSALPSADSVPLMEPLIECRARFIDAYRWKQDIGDYVRGLPCTRTVMEPHYSGLEALLQEAQITMVGASDRMGFSWSEVLSVELQRFKTDTLTPASEVRFEYIISLASDHLAQLRQMMGRRWAFDKMEQQLIQCRAALDDMQAAKSHTQTPKGTLRKQGKKSGKR